MSSRKTEENKKIHQTSIARAVFSGLFVAIYSVYELKVLLLLQMLHLSISLFWIFGIEYLGLGIRNSPWLVYFRIFLDTSLVTLLIYATGATYSPMTIAYAGLVIFSSMRLEKGPGRFSSLFGNFLFLLLALLIYYRVLPVVNIMSPSGGEMVTLQSIVINVPVVAAGCFVLYKVVNGLYAKSIVAQQATEKARAEIEKLNDFSKSLHEMTDLDDILQKIFQYMPTEFGIDGMFLTQVDKENKEFYVSKVFVPPNITQENLKWVSNLRLPMESYIGSQMFTYRRKKLLYQKHIRKNITEVDQMLVDRLGFNSYLQVPLVIRDEVVGIVNFTKYKIKRKLSDSDVSSISRFCEQIAGAINGSSLLKETKEARAEAESAREIAEIEQEKSENLLLNILPKKVAEELKNNGTVEPYLYDSVSVLFTDFVGFTEISETMPPADLIKELDACFTQFDSIIEHNGLEKLKTIGDSYMCAGGLPQTNHTHPIDVCMVGLEMQAFMEQMQKIKSEMNLPYWELRLGINTGPVTSGVVGKHKFAYDIWGDTVNIASRMESVGKPRQVNISGATYELVKDFFDCETRGHIEVKGKGEMELYFVNRIKTELSQDDEGRIPNDKFREKYKYLKGV